MQPRTSRELLGLSSTAGLINDLEATALGLATLRGGGRSDPERRAWPTRAAWWVSSLREQVWAKQGSSGRRERAAAIATEGGNAGFAPASSEQTRLLEFLREGPEAHVSVEYGLLGVAGSSTSFGWCLHEAGRGEPGLVRPTSTRTGRRAGGHRTHWARQARRRRGETRARALRGRSTALKLGNLALRLLATGGIYIAARHRGQAPRPSSRTAASWPRSPARADSRTLLHTIPVHVVTNELTALLGAARHASERRPLALERGRASEA